jgi:uncharacterized protein (TIGR00297 family)
VTSTVRRAGAFAAVGTIALSMPLLNETAATPFAAAAPFAAIAVLAVFQIHDGPVFELFARPGERRDRRLYGLIGFTLAATGVVLLAAVSGMPSGVAVGSILMVAYGNFAAQAVRTKTDETAVVTGAFAVGGALAYVVGEAVTRTLERTVALADLPEVLFLAAAGGLLAALLRSMLYESDDPLVMVSVGLWLWMLAELAVDVVLLDVVLALAVTVFFGYASYALDTASIPGMLTGVTAGVVIVVLGGLGWFAVLVTFFGVGGLSTKFRYDRKLERGVAEPNEGARGTANVLANGTVALVAVLLAAAARAGVDPVAVVFPVDGGFFLYAFVGAVATAMSDTLSSEIGGVYDDPRLITTLRRVDPGTDGAITWQGELAGLVGAVLVGSVAYLAIDAVGQTGLAVTVVAGVAGMTADSLLGATVEGDRVGNSTVNFLATVVGAVVGVVLAVALGVATGPTLSV